MEEQNKYYTPKLEEFRVGFEFEYHEHFGKNFGNWSKIIVDENDSFFTLSNLLASMSVRVKYLDKEDIESLGFNIILQDQYNIECWGKNIILLVDSDYYIQIIIQEDGIENYLFQGTIKNKSELKVLLTQLGIN